MYSAVYHPPEVARSNRHRQGDIFFARTKTLLD